MPAATIMFALAAFALGASAPSRIASILLARRERPGAELPRVREGIACGLVLASLAAASFLTLDPLPCLLAVLGGAAMEAVCLCDLRTRIIPWELCACLLALAVPFAVVSGTPASLLRSALLAVFLLGLLWACNRANGHRRGAPAIGSGDLRLMPALCLFCGVSGSLLGLLACSLLMGCIAVAALVSGNAKLSSRLPLAPGLAFWFATGLYANAGITPLILM